MSKGNANGGVGIDGSVELLLPLPFVLINDVSLSCLGVLGRIDTPDSSLSSSLVSRDIGIGRGIDILLKS